MVRDALATDFPVIAAMHRAMGSDYRLPDLSSPLIIANKVAVEPQGIVGCSFIRLTAETFLLLDPALNAKRKFQAIQSMHDAIISKAWCLGLDDLNARIPPETSNRFAKRLKQLGWEQSRGWIGWSREIL